MHKISHRVDRVEEEHARMCSVMYLSNEAILIDQVCRVAVVPKMVSLLD